MHAHILTLHISQGNMFTCAALSETLYKNWALHGYYSSCLLSEGGSTVDILAYRTITHMEGQFAIMPTNNIFNIVGFFLFFFL